MSQRRKGERLAQTGKAYVAKVLVAAAATPSTSIIPARLPFTVGKTRTRANHEVSHVHSCTKCFTVILVLNVRGYITNDKLRYSLAPTITLTIHADIS